jgi:acyl-CoA dehydrogenase
MDFAVPQDAQDVAAGLLTFIDRYVAPLEERNRAVLESERDRYGPDGRFVPAVVELRKQVRMASAEAGFYKLFADAIRTCSSRRGSTGTPARTGR